jgi:mRNA-degrading endonuclease RelE of RelBE toxin-antitoxin system
MNKLPIRKQIAVLQRLEEGTSVRSTAKLESVSRITIRTLVRSGITIAELEKLKAIANFIKELEFQAREKVFELQQGQDNTQLQKKRVGKVRVYISKDGSAETLDILPCGKTRNDCTGCRDIFTDKCKW